MSGAIAAAFEVKLRQQGSALTHEDLLSQYPPSTPHVKESAPVGPLSQYQFYDDFASTPDEANEKVQREIADAIKIHGKEYVDDILRSRQHHKLRRQRRNDFRLNVAEQERLQLNGFVVSERLSATNFAEIYYRLYTDDMPVFVTSDSVLHAWHRSFDAFLVELEEQLLMPLLESILFETREASKRMYQIVPPSIKSALQDVELFLASAESLLRDEPIVHGTLENEGQLTALLDYVDKGQLVSVDLFGSTRQIDFSLFKPRGHYNKTDQLKLYFRAMAWLGTIDFRVDGTDNKASDLHQLQCACLLVHLLRQANAINKVKTLDAVVSMIAGDGIGSDSMTPVLLHELLGDSDILSNFFGPDSEQNLTSLQHELANQRFGAQAIAGHPMEESKAAALSQSTPTRLPTSFTFAGQQFVWSAFVFSKLVFDQVVHSDVKVARRLPSAVDVAFALFGNNLASGVIAERMTSTPKGSGEYVPFRDGLPYASNLMAVRELVDEQLRKADPATCSLALLWQLALRELSAASACESSVFHSEAWTTRQMNTQIASFAQLRHDTILYAKQSFTMGTRCEYAAGYVDPYPGFWGKMQQLGERTLDIVSQLKAFAPTEDDEPPMLYKAQHFFENFAEVMQKLTNISLAQVAKRELDEEQTCFLKTVIEERRGSGASRYLGWYPSLFYTHREDSGKQDHLVADVHTDVPSVEHGDPGGILHIGVGNVNFGVFIVDKTVYAGPVFSTYEFVTKINDRLTDAEFGARLGEFAAPAWATKSFLVADGGDP